MEWQCFQYSDECANTYVWMHEDHAIVFDPSKNSSHLLDFFKKRKVTLDAIFLTHGHFDHIGGVKILTQYYHCPIFAGEEEIALLRDPYKNVSLHFHHPMIIEEAISPLYDGQVLCLHDMEIQVITTPFHTRGSVCYYLPKLHKMVSGDTLFKGCVGRSDLPTGNAHQMKKSLDKLVQFASLHPEQIIVYPGHGEKTILEEEIKNNPYFQK